ncbi:MAG: hypothetical protein ACRDG3_13570 [Tepidiformaceae bacterium]
MQILPVACTLSRDELERGAKCLMPGLLARAPNVIQLADGLRLEFDRGPDVLRDITDVMERERKCCRFLQFVLTISPGDDPFRLDITGPEGTTEFLAEVSRVAAR